MPITITPQQPLDRVGPGLLLSWSSDVFGPFPTGTNWHVVVSPDPEGDRKVINTTIPWFQNTGTIMINSDTTNSGLQSMVADQADVHVIVSLSDATTVYDTGSRVAKWDATAGLGQQLQAKASGGGGGGFTAADRATANASLEAVVYAIGGGLTAAVLDKLSIQGDRLFHQVLITPDRTGEGSFTEPGASFPPVQYGIAFQIVSFSEGLGRDEANPDQLEIDWLELSLMMNKPPIGLVARQSNWYSQLAGYIYWGTEPPDALSYYVLPGVSVRFWWLQFGLTSSTEGPAPAARSSPPSPPQSI